MNMFNLIGMTIVALSEGFGLSQGAPLGSGTAMSVAIGSALNAVVSTGTSAIGGVLNGMSLAVNQAKTVDASPKSPLIKQ